MSESRREENKKRCRLKILKASRRLFREKGYENTMMEDIAAKAELSKATIYNYFPNKESLLIGTLEDEMEASKNILEHTDRNMNSYERIKHVMLFLIADSIPFIEVSRRILFLNACKGSPLYGMVGRINEMLLPVVEKGHSEGVFRIETAAEDIVSMIIGFYLNSQFNWPDIADISKKELEERISSMLDLTLAGCMVQ